MRAWLFPGQGVQRRGIGEDVFGLFPSLVEIADEILGYSIEELCLQDPEKKLGETRYSQTAIFVVTALTFLLRRRAEGWPDFVAGHSLGEYSALFAAGSFDFETGVRIIDRRAELMAEVSGGAMLAVIGPVLRELLELLAELELDDVDVANYNSPIQTVLSGPTVAIDALADVVVTRQLGRAVRLHINGAFHSRYAGEAADQFEAFLGTQDLRDPLIPTISNVTGKRYEAGTVLPLLSRQIRSSVRWWDSMLELQRAGVTEAYQVGPGSALARLWEQAAAAPAPLAGAG